MVSNQIKVSYYEFGIFPILFDLMAEHEHIELQQENGCLPLPVRIVRAIYFWGKFACGRNHLLPLKYFNEIFEYTQ